MKEMTPSEKKLIGKLLKQAQQVSEWYNSTSPEDEVQKAYFDGQRRAYRFAIIEIYEYLEEISK